MSHVLPELQHWLGPACLGKPRKRRGQAGSVRPMKDELYESTAVQAVSADLLLGTREVERLDLTKLACFSRVLRPPLDQIGKSLKSGACSGHVDVLGQPAGRVLKNSPGLGLNKARSTPHRSQPSGTEQCIRKVSLGEIAWMHRHNGDGFVAV